MHLICVYFYNLYIYDFETVVTGSAAVKTYSKYFKDYKHTETNIRR